MIETTHNSRTARIAAVSGIPALLRRFGVALPPLLTDAGLPADTFEDLERREPVGRLLHLLVRCTEESQCPHFGLLLGQPVQPQALGAAGRRLLGAPSVERALRGLIMNLHLNGEAVVPALTVRIDSAYLSITPYADHPRGNDQLEDLSLAIATNILRFLCGPRWAPSLVSFAHRAPPDPRPYTAFFKAPLRFGEAISAVMFDLSWLTHRPDTAHPGEAVHSPPPIAEGLDLSIRARRAIIGGMAQGVVGVDSVASLVGLSRRTLNRRLAERGTSTKELIAEVRVQIAQQLMRDTDLPLADIAATTCYSDVAAFSRAFSARVGLSPAAWRNAERSQSNVGVAFSDSK